MHSTIVSSLAIAMVAFSLNSVVTAVCSDGQIAVGYEVSYALDPGAPSTAYYSGFEMANDCNIISQNGITESGNQMCNHGYYNGADITCSDKSHVTAAKDTTGNSYTCSNSGYDTSCDITSGLSSFYVSACCTRD